MTFENLKATGNDLTIVDPETEEITLVKEYTVDDITVRTLGIHFIDEQIIYYQNKILELEALKLGIEVLESS